MNHKRLKRLQLNNLPVFLTHPRVVLVDVIALHSHSPWHQRYLSEECCFRFLSLIGFKRKKVISCLFFSLFSSSQEEILAFPLSTYPFPSGHSPHEVAVWPPQFTSSPPDPVEKWVHVRMLREINLVHPHVLLVPLLLYFLVFQLFQK